ncbi:unnamed protein product, partial [Prorocentrum cordatum]
GRGRGAQRRRRGLGVLWGPEGHPAPHSDPQVRERKRSRSRRRRPASPCAGAADMAARRLAAQHGCPGAGAGAYVVALACDDGASAPDCLVASVSEDAGGGGLLEVLDLPQLRPACAVRGPHAGAAAEDLCFLRGSPRCLASCGADGSALLWDLREGGGGQVRPARTLLAGGGDPAAAVALCPDGRLCACASGAAVRVLELGSGRELF